MNKVAKFEKVSYAQFYEEMKKLFTENGVPDEDGNPVEDIASVPEFDQAIQAAYDSIELPTRATKFSSGYDFKAPFRFEMAPGDTLKIPTGIRALFSDKSYCLLMIPRSSQGIKYGIRFSNTAGNVDADYSDADNEGHIFIKLENWGEKMYVAEPGDKIGQGIFVPYGITEDDAAEGERTGGIGSTGK